MSKFKWMMKCANFEILAGDFKPGHHSFTWGNFNMPQKGFWSSDEKIPIAEVNSFEKASEESTKSMAGKVGMGVAGAALLGPVGLLAGTLAGGEKKHVVFVCEFKDGRRFLGKAKQKDFETLMTATFDFVTTPQVS